MRQAGAPALALTSARQLVFERADDARRIFDQQHVLRTKVIEQRLELVKGRQVALRAEERATASNVLDQRARLGRRVIDVVAQCAQRVFRATFAVWLLHGFGGGWYQHAFYFVERALVFGIEG